MALNNIDFEILEQDTLISVESYKIADFKTRNAAYEGHYQHYGTRVTTKNEKVHFSEGDYVIPVRQNGIRYLIETLEPSAPDSFFNWNFFDPILQQKEGFSPYIFEDEAAKMLQENVALRDSFQIKKSIDPEFSNNWYAQLDWLYKQSDHYESAHMQYPVYRVLK